MMGTLGSVLDMLFRCCMKILKMSSLFFLAKRWHCFGIAVVSYPTTIGSGWAGGSLFKKCLYSRTSNF